MVKCKTWTFEWNGLWAGMEWTGLKICIVVIEIIMYISIIITLTQKTSKNIYIYNYTDVGGFS